MKGIDIASMQGTVNFAKVKATGIEIVYIKATEGLTYNSPTMLAQYNGARAAGLKIGFYHYLRANNPVAEADHFLSIIKGLTVDCLYGIDVEVPLRQTATQVSSNVKQFSDHLISKGFKTCVYTGDAFYSAYLNESVRDICSWIAHYGVAKPDVVGYVGFQYSESGRLNGINGDVDLDTFSNAILLNSEVTMGNIVRSVGNMPIKQGEKSRRVSLLQSILNVIFTGSIKVIDGDFGSITLGVVERYQKAMGLTADGVVGLKTINVLMLDMKNNYFKL